MEWKDSAALGGLALGILNLWLLVFRKRPFSYVEPAAQYVSAAGARAPTLRLRIVNPSDLPLQISGLTRLGYRRNMTLLGLAPRQFMYAEEGAATLWMKFNQFGIFRDFIDPKETRYYGIYDLEEKHWLLLTFWWHRNGLLRFRLPMWIVLSRRRLVTMINQSPEISI